LIVTYVTMIDIQLLQ